MESIYRHLQRKLNTVANGVPATERGVELDYLAELYTEEQAEFALNMPVGLHSLEVIAGETGKTEEEALDILEAMTRRGTLYRVRDKNDVKYMLVPAYHGYVEFNVYQMTPTLVEGFGKHYAMGLRNAFFSHDIPVFRCFPVRPDIVEDGCLDSDNIELLLKQQTKAVATECMCRMMGKLHPKRESCRVNTDNTSICIMFGEFADFYTEQGLGYSISMDEVMEIWHDCDKNGCVVESFNKDGLTALCSCCSCCCGVLNAYKAIDGLGKHRMSNYIMRYEEESCLQCGKCAERCPVDAIKIVDGRIEYHSDGCLGCGLCVTTCPAHAAKLYRKPEEELNIPTATTIPELYEQIQVARHKRGEI